MYPGNFKKPLRLLCLFAIAGLGGCGDASPPPPPPVFGALNYDYLPPIVLNISNITIANNYVPDAGAEPLIGQDPAPPAPTLTAMLQHRLVANGTPGNGTVTIENASIEPVADNYVGVMAVRLDVASSDGLKTGFTEASVSVSQSMPDADADPDQTQAVLYSITKQLMDAMNVQLQYQIQHNMGSWISYTSTAVTPPLNSGSPDSGGIQAAPLGAPGAPEPGVAVPSVAEPGVAEPGVPQPLTLPPQPGVPALPPSSQSLGTLPVTAVPSLPQ